MSSLLFHCVIRVYFNSTKAIFNQNMANSEIIDGFKTVSSIEKMPFNEICTYCWLEHYDVMQRSEYFAYDEFFQSQLQYSFTRCEAEDTDVSIRKSPIDKPETSGFCVGDEIYTTVSGDTCDKIARAKSLSSAALYQGNPATIANCSSIPTGKKLCLPVRQHIPGRLSRAGFLR